MPIAAVTDDFLMDRLHDVFAAASGLPGDRVVWEAWNDLRPAPGTYLSLYRTERRFLRNMPAFGGDPYREFLLNVVEDSLRVSAWGKDAQDVITRAASQVSSTDRWLDLWPYMGQVELGGMRDTSHVWQGAVQRRWQLEFRYQASLAALAVPGDPGGGALENPQEWVEDVPYGIVWVTLEPREIEITGDVFPGGN